MTALIQLIGQYGIAFVFACVFVEQAGVPFPAYPVLLVAGSLVARGQLSEPAAGASAVVACLLADSLWFVAGRRHGGAVLRLLCRLSLTPDHCVQHTEAIFRRWGPRSLAVAKLIPGFASVATAMAGATGVSAAAFLVYDAIGAALWAGIGIALGHVFAPAVADLLLALEDMGRWGMLFLASCLTLWIAARLWRRHQFLGWLRMERISVHALASMLESGEAPLVVDVRAPGAPIEDRIPGSVVFNDNAWPDELRAADQAATVVLYCDCPNETTAALAAKKLMQRGFTRCGRSPAASPHGGMPA